MDRVSCEPSCEDADVAMVTQARVTRWISPNPFPIFSTTRAMRRCVRRPAPRQKLEACRPLERLTILIVHSPIFFSRPVISVQHNRQRQRHAGISAVAADGLEQCRRAPSRSWMPAPCTARPTMTPLYPAGFLVCG